MNPREESELSEWFNALDINQSGTIEENEIRALMHGMGLEVSTVRLVRMFAAIGKPVDARLTKTEFVRFMTANIDALSPGSGFASASGAGAVLNDPNAQLMMLSYRRQRLLADVADPSKRRNFNSVESFNHAYGANLGGTDEAPPPTPQAPSHPFSSLPPVSPRAL